LKESSDGETLIAVGNRIMVPDLWSSRGESTTSKVDLYLGDMQEGLVRGGSEGKQVAGL